MRTSLLLAAMLAVVICPQAMAQPISIHAFVDRTIAGEAEPVTFTIEIQGDVRSTPQTDTPRAQGLSLSQTTPRRETSVVISNGVRTSTTRLSWIFVPDRAGYAEIAPVTLTINGQRFATDPITVRVVPQAQRPVTRATPPPGTTDVTQDDIFLVAVPDTTVAFVGQQVSVDFVLYYLPELSPRNARATGSWDAPGFWREEFELQTPVQSEIVELNGRHFQAAVIKRTAFFATRSGELQIDPLSISIDVLRGQRLGGPSGPFFNPFATRYARQTISSSAIAIRVLPLPGGAPASFGGAVGWFTMDASRVPTQNPEAVGLRVNIVGDGNPATLDPPSWTDLNGIDSFPPRTDSRIDRSGQQIITRHQFDYTFVPRTDAPRELPALEWSFFDPVARRYETITGATIPLDGIAPPRDATLADVPGVEIHRTASWAPVRSRARVSPLLYLAAGLAPPVVAALLLAVLVGVRRRRVESEPLARARASLSSGNTDAAAIGPIVRLYLRDRLDLPTRAMTTSEIEAFLRQHSITPVAVEVLAEALRSSDQAAFSGTREANGAAPDVLQALKTIDRTTT